MGKTGLILYTDDWEALYVDGKLVAGDHSLESPIDWVIWTNEYGLTDLKNIELSEEDSEEICLTGCCPEDITDFKTDYLK